MQIVTICLKRHEITVVPDTQAVNSEGLVVWDIDNRFPKGIKKVKIEFKQKTVKYFEDKGTAEGDHEIAKGINETLVIWGRAAPVAPGTVVTDEYTVYGLDVDGGEVVKKDPRIIVTEP